MKKRDWILIGSIVAVAIIACIVFFTVNALKKKNSVIVELNGKEIARYSLSQDGEYSLNGGTNVLRIQDGKAYIVEADCPDQKCVKMGAAKALKPIVCLPNKLSVKLADE